MYGYIYETTNLINGKKYIGKHKSNKFDYNYYGSGIGLKKALNKYGKENFKVIILEKIQTNQKDLDLKEIYYIEKYNAVKDKNYYNQSYGAENEGWAGYNKAAKEKNYNSFKGKHHTKETKLKISKKRKEYYKKYGFPEETRKKISKANKGKVVSEETKQKMRNHKFTKEHREKISKAQSGKNNSMYGKHLSKNVKKHLSEIRKNRIWINNNINEKWINKDEINIYFAQGFVKGRLKRKK